MAITVVNATPAQGLEFSICGYVDGSANPPMWSGSLGPVNTSGSQIQMDVSGYDAYSVGFYIVGWNGDNWPVTWSKQVPDDSTVSFAINVFA
ncbi:MAG TPA: hypothetical protein VF668_22845 [Pyrinomonadaceae bacterium]|jgi:hypothetical protein